MKQLSIFDVVSIKQSLIEKYAKYGIDNQYVENFKDTGSTLYAIHEKLSTDSRYEEYLNLIYNELIKYLEPCENCYDEFYNRSTISSISKFKGGLTIYDALKKCVGPIYCLEMINSDLLERN